MSDYPGWQGILEDGETILWQGRPEKGVRWLDGLRTNFVMGIVITCFALFWMYEAAKSGTLMWIFGMLFLLLGLKQLAEPTIIPAYIRSRSWYTLTNRRAIIATDMPVRGRQLNSVPITRETEVTFEPGDPGSIFFGPIYVARKQGNAFLLIHDAEAVMRLIREVQTADGPPDQPPSLDDPFQTELHAKDAP